LQPEKERRFDDLLNEIYVDNMADAVIEAVFRRYVMFRSIQ